MNGRTAKLLNSLWLQRGTEEGLSLKERWHRTPRPSREAFRRYLKAMLRDYEESGNNISGAVVR